MSNLKDIRLQTAKRRYENTSKKHLQTRSWEAIVWKNWRGHNRWDKKKAIQQAYERNPAFYAAANLIAQTIADMPVYVEYRKRGSVDNTIAHPILKTLERDSSREEFIEMMVLYLVVTGESYSQIIFSETGLRKRPLGLIALPSQYVTPVFGDQYNPIKHYELQNRTTETLYPEEIIFIKKPDLSNYFEGMSPAIPLAEVLDLNNAGITWNKNVALAGGIPPVIAKAPSGMSREEGKEVQDGFQEQSGANNAHRLKIISGDLDIQDLGTDPHDAEWEKAILLSMRMILMGLGVSSSLMNDAANKTYNNVKDSRKALYLDACLPLGDKIYNKISNELRGYYDDNPTIKIDRDSIEALQEDQKAQAERLSDLKLSGIISANEARAVLKWPKSKDSNADLLETAKTPSQVKPPDEPVSAQQADEPTNPQTDG